MSNKIYSFDELTKKIGEILSNFPVQKAILFGSYAKGEADEKSDIDLVIDSNDQIRGLKFFGVRSELEECLEKEVDLIEQKDIITDGETDREILKTGIVIYEA